ncbi:MAG: TM1812 family CRISPR-associated protein, partial [Bacteroidota bacterium]|nr:TM1812 family CRISPR-associated protein [Bacteroidota bacterium]
MARKVFISVLGTGYYSKTKYYCENKDENVETHFIQEAMLKFYSNEFKKNDKAYLFLTRKARNDNWESPAQKNNKFVIEGKSDSYQGLEETLKGFDFDVISKDIPDGNNEEEIWEIFQKVFDVLELEDEVYFDITHAFRSIPMLIMVLINYAKFLKKINVKSITYGNWEGRD